MESWYYRIGTKEFGPITKDELLHAIEHGELTKNTLVHSEEMKEWVQAKSVNGLLSLNVAEQTKRLPLFETISKAYTLMLQNISILWKPLLITGLIMIALDSFITPHTIEMLILYKLIYWALFVVFSVATHRLLLLGKDSVATHGLTWSRRELTFALYMVGIYILIMLLSFAMMPILMMFSSPNGVDPLFLMILVSIPIEFLFVRLSILFPAISVDTKDIDWKWAMGVTQNNGWRLMALLLVLPLSFQLLLSPLRGDSIIINVLIQLIMMVLLVFEITTLSLSFKYLTDFNGVENEENS